MAMDVLILSAENRMEPLALFNNMLNILLNILQRVEEEEKKERWETYNRLHCIESYVDNEYKSLYLYRGYEC